MQIIESPQDMQRAAQQLRREGKTISFVPTMGFLHQGHLSLMQLARERCDVVVASIFVNPTQFGPNEDLDAYPRDFERDEALCRAEGVDILFYPRAATMYCEDHSVWVDESILSGGLCGAARPSHFKGVCTVVAKLLNLVLPDVLVLGEKDAQQLRVLRRMIRDLNFPVEIVPGPIVRESDGLALSSRNKYLTPTERVEALCLSQSLAKARACFEEGMRDADELKAVIRDVIEATSGEVDYIEVVCEDSLEPLKSVLKPVLLVLAVKFPGARLIDNAVMGQCL